MPPMRHFREENMHGRNVIAGLAPHMGTRRVRKLRSNRRSLVPRPANGIHDPITFYHVLDALLGLIPGETFRAVDFVEYLRTSRTSMIWDPTTVGRVINDIAESLELANASRPIEVFRRWDGANYMMSDRLEDRIAMENLLDDLEILSRETLQGAAEGRRQKRLESPMRTCPSVTLP